MSRRQPGLPSLCPFRSVTGVPCPACGSTRAVMATVDGRWLDAVLLNPLFCAAVAVALGGLVLRFGFGRRVAFPVAPDRRRVVWAAAALLVFANWAYVIWRVG